MSRCNKRRLGGRRCAVCHSGWLVSPAFEDCTAPACARCSEGGGYPSNSPTGSIRSRKCDVKYILLYKPYGVLCQFTGAPGQVTLARLGPFPRNLYPAGRLDADSEGLVLLTDDGLLKHRLTDPAFGHRRTYLVQVEGVPGPEALRNLRDGVIFDRKKSLPAEVESLPSSPDLPSRAVPIRYRKSVPTAWLRITLREGRNRQIRKMTAAVGHPTLRLVRIGIGPLSIGGLLPGRSRSLNKREIRHLRRLLGIEELRGHRTSGRSRSSVS